MLLADLGLERRFELAYRNPCGTPRSRRSSKGTWSPSAVLRRFSSTCPIGSTPSDCPGRPLSDTVGPIVVNFLCTLFPIQCAIAATSAVSAPRSSVSYHIHLASALLNLLSFSTDSAQRKRRSCGCPRFVPHSQVTPPLLASIPLPNPGSRFLVCHTRMTGRPLLLPSPKYVVIAVHDPLAKYSLSSDDSTCPALVVTPCCMQRSIPDMLRKTRIEFARGWRASV